MIKFRVGDPVKILETGNFGVIESYTTAPETGRTFWTVALVRDRKEKRAYLADELEPAKT